MNHLFEYTREELEGRLTELGLPRYRTAQVLQWAYQNRPQRSDESPDGAGDNKVIGFGEMTNLPRELRRMLNEEYSLEMAQLEQVATSQDGARKLLLRWPDGALTETVVMPGPARNTACVSSQVGCAVGCVFCASGVSGLERNLTAGEIVEQVMWSQRQLPEGDRLSHVVVMGMGEPLLNYENTLKALAILNADWGLNIAARHLTVSTVGLPNQIRRLAKESLQLTLAVSLHAGEDELRERLIPWKGLAPLETLFDSLKEYYSRTHREITLEYVLLDGLNCLPGDADRLAYWARQTRCNVNLISYNPVAGLAVDGVQDAEAAVGVGAACGFAAPSASTTRAFMRRLQNAGVNVHLRRSRGQEIEAACGQLRRRAKGSAAHGD